MDRLAEPARETPRWRAYAWGVLAVLSCPCHLPLLAVALASTSMGALLSKHEVTAALLLATLFLLALSRALRAFRGNEPNSRPIRSWCNRCNPARPLDPEAPRLWSDDATVQSGHRKTRFAGGLQAGNRSL